MHDQSNAKDQYFAMGTWVRVLLYSALSCLALAIGGAFLHKFDIASLTTSAIPIGLAFAIAIIVAVLSVTTIFIRIVRKQSYGLFTLLFAFLICFLLLGNAAINYNKLITHPATHDISTDLADPPQFSEAIRDRRGPTANSVAMTENKRKLHKGAYDDIQTFAVSTSQSFTYSAALELVEDRGWELVTQDVANGKIEAIAETFWLGFKDDVAIRIRADEANNQTLVDVRSVSRIGVADFGVNAERIRNFLSDLRSRLVETQS